MSQKVPVGDVLNEAVQFGLHRWATVLRFAWLPFVISIGLFLGYVIVAFGTAVLTMESGESDWETIKSAMQFSVPVMIVLGIIVYAIAILLYCGVAASIFRLVALGEERPGIFQLRVDGPAVRVFMAYLIISVIGIVIWGAAFTIALNMSDESWGSVGTAFMRLIEWAAATEANETTDLEAFSALADSLKAFGLAFLIAIIPQIYVSVKLAPFPAGSAAENRLLLFGSFGMTFGHAWSIFFIFVLFIIFMIVLTIIYELAMLIFQMLAGVLVVQGGLFALIAAAIFIGIFIVSVFYQLFIVALQMSIPAIIYRRLKTGE